MFYKDGLTFSCQRCLYCCSTEPGYVFLSKDDIENGASFLGLSPAEFVNIYCRYIDYGTYQMISLKEKSNYDCIFLSKSGCIIYSSRPVQCRTYPFWKNIIESQKSWNEESHSCPGIGKGNRIPCNEIEKAMKENEDNPPVIILKNMRNPYSIAK